MPTRPPKECAYPGCHNPTFNARYCDGCRKRNTRVFLVIGPSGSGKSTYVREHAQRGDLILDFDLLFAAISNLPIYDKPPQLTGFVLAARTAIIHEIGLIDHIPHAWIIRNKITRQEVQQMREQLGAEVIELRESPEECKRRIDADPQRPAEQRKQWHQRIDEWWLIHG